MAEPTFNGVNFFGPCPTSNRVELPNARQLNSFPGVAGVEVIEHGARTSYTEFAGIWYAEEHDDLGAFLTQLIAIKRNAGIYTLVDTKGVVSPDAILEGFETEEESKWSPTLQAWTIGYRLRFLHTGFVPSN